MKFTRDQIIDLLVDNNLDTIRCGEGDRWISDIFINGFDGYKNLSNDDLIQLYVNEIDDIDDIEITE